MYLIKEICNNLFGPKDDEEELDSPEFLKQSEKCQKEYDKLFDTLDEKQKKLLLNLDHEQFMLWGQQRNEGFFEGAEKGFKAAVRLILDCLRE